VLAGSAVLTALTLGVIYAAGGEVLSMHGWIALSLGAFFSYALAGGLMTLVFVSARRGYDDRIEMDRGEDL
jgi:hypothetical protein